jgi:pre-mRNA 3'-end-processing factor FIP1
VSSRSQVTLQSGKSYPEVRTSTIDVNGNPVYPPVGKPITEIEADADLAEHEKPWRRPGADQTDYFNYGFDEFTWSTYCLRQKTMADALTEQKAENSQFERMFGGSGAAAMMPGMAMPAMPPGAAGGDMSGMSAMMGMPSMPDAQSMQQMMQQLMVEQGITDPSQLDFQQVMNRMQAGAGAMMGQPSIPSGPAAQQQSYGGANWQQGGYGRGGGGKQRGRW